MSDNKREWKEVFSLKAVVFNGNKRPSFSELPEQQPKKGEVKVRLKSAGLNRRDLFVLKDSLNEQKQFILGSDGAGIVESIGNSVSAVHLQDEVIINPSLYWDKTEVVPELPQILGSPTDGTFAETVIVPQENICLKPSFLSWEEAGVLSLSALTAYRALFTKGQLQAKQHLLIPGIGSGVATYALKFAKAIGATVTVTSRNKQKLQKAKEIGADYLLGTNEDWQRVFQYRKADLILDSIGSATFPKYFEILKPNGTIVNFGQSSGSEVELSLKEFFYSQFNLLGTSMGSKEEFEQMIQLVTDYKIKPIIDRTYQLSEYKLALKRMAAGLQFGNIAFTIN